MINAPLIKHRLKLPTRWAGGIVLWLRALAALPEDQGLSPSTLLALRWQLITICNFSPRRHDIFFRPTKVPHAHAFTGYNINEISIMYQYNHPTM